APAVARRGPSGAGPSRSTGGQDRRPGRARGDGVHPRPRRATGRRLIPPADGMRVIVEAGARIHLGFLDLNGSCGRRFGSIGVSLARRRCQVEARRAVAGAPDSTVEPVRAILERLTELGDVAVAVRLTEAIPSHAGFGSGTQHALAVALAATRAAGRS